MRDLSGFKGASCAWGQRVLAGTIVALLVSLAWLPGVAGATGITPPEVTARAVFAFDPASGEVILESNANEPMLVGSITKIVTGLVTVDHLAMDDTVTIQPSDQVDPGFSSMGLQPGDVLTVEQLLTGLFVVSGGDAAWALARTVGAQLSGSDDRDTAIAAFVDAMNEKAAALGATDSVFANPDGEDADGAHSTAHDIALLFAAVEANPQLAALAAMPDYSIMSVSATPYAGTSTNELVGSHGITGSKTGSTEAAGGCIVFQRSAPGGDPIIVAILGSTLVFDEQTWQHTEDQRWNDAVAVLDAIDAGWQPGMFLSAEPTAEPTSEVLAGEGGTSSQEGAAPTVVADASRSGLSTDDAGSQGARGNTMAAVLASVGLLAFAGVFAWSSGSARERSFPIE